MIKFRAWDIWNKRWLTNFNISSEGKVKVYDNSYTFEEAGGVFEVVQSTNLTDKNGKKIYEGDIVRWELTTSAHTSIHNVEVHRDIDGQWILAKDGNELYRNRKNVEVIGNVYENPELLEEEIVHIKIIDG